jgi:lysophospholipase L1-like esterase
LRAKSAQGIAFCDLKPDLVTAARTAYAQTGALVWWPDDTHWNEAGHRAAADAVYEHLLRDRIKRG